MRQAEEDLTWPDWGSAITPQTPEAWTLHYADCLSAWFENGLYTEKKV